LRLCAAALTAAILAVPAPASGQGFDPEIQRSFIEGGRLLEAGDYEGAARIFRALLQRAPSPRIKLELARALFLQKRYGEARGLFREVALDPSTPWQVRENIETYIGRIDAIAGFTKFSVSMVSDSNPRNITDQREFTIGGVRLTFQPPEDNKKVYGLRYGMQTFQPLLPESGLSVYATGSYLDYPNDTFDRLTVDGGLSKTLGEQRDASVKAGVEAGTFGGRALYRLPYVGAGYLFSASEVHRVTGELKLGKVTFPYYSFLDATYTSAALAGTRAISKSAALSLGGSVEHSVAREDPYSYDGVAISPGAVFLIADPAVVLRADTSFGVRKYAAADPLFGDRRLDRRTTFALTLKSREWQWSGFHPGVVLSFEENRSTLDFYSYRKVNLALVFE
jgi:hypothetical protein